MRLLPPYGGRNGYGREVPTPDLSTARTRSVLSGTALGLAAAWPVSRAERGPVLCPFRALTGLPCPFCGLTRSFVYTVHGQLPQAFGAHLFGPLLVLLAGAWLVTGRRHAGTALDPQRWLGGTGRPWVVLCGGAWAAFAVIRLAVAAGP